MIDARFEAARRTDQSGDRGWDLFPEPSVSEFRRPSFVLVVLACVLAAVSLVGMVLR